MRALSAGRATASGAALGAAAGVVTAADPAEAGMGIAAAADRGAATGSAALEEAATGCGAAAGAMTTTEPLEPAPAEAMFSELYEFSSARAGVANDVSTNIAPAKKNEAKRDEGAKSPSLHVAARQVHVCPLCAQYNS